MKELSIWVPCKPANDKSGLEPTHVPLIAADGTNDSRWECPHCKMRFHRRKPARMHMGLVMNIPHGCSVMKALDESRRKKRTEEKENLSDAMWEIRERERMNKQDGI